MRRKGGILLITFGLVGVGTIAMHHFDAPAHVIGFWAGWVAGVAGINMAYRLVPWGPK